MSGFSTICLWILMAIDAINCYMFFSSLQSIFHWIFAISFLFMLIFIVILYNAFKIGGILAGFESLIMLIVGFVFWLFFEDVEIFFGESQYAVGEYLMAMGIIHLVPVLSVLFGDRSYNLE